MAANLEADLAVFKACADATRLRVLFLLDERELCVCELVAALRMPQGKVSRHLGVLKRAGLVRDRREGTWIFYSLASSDGGLADQLATYLGRAADSRPELVADRQRLQELDDPGLGLRAPAGTGDGG